MQVQIQNIANTMSTRELSKLCDKHHKHVCRDVEKLNETYDMLGMPKVGQGYYTHHRSCKQKQKGESRLNDHPCQNKCSEFQNEQCKNCLIQQIEKREFDLGLAPDTAYVKNAVLGLTEGDIVVFIDDFMPDHLMTVHKVQGDGILLDGNRKFAVIHLLRRATEVELEHKKRISEAESIFSEVFGVSTLP